MVKTFTCLLLLVASAATARAATSPGSRAAPDSVRLRFGWKPGMSARVEFEGSRSRAGSGRDGRQQTGLSMHLSVTAHPRGLSIASDSVTVGPGPRGEMERFLARVSGASPTQLVSPAGEFLGLDQVTKFRAHLLSGLDSVLSTSDAPVEARRAVANMVTEQMLQASAADQWNSMVGFWADADLELGETLTIQTSGPSPIRPDVQIPMTIEFGAVRRAPCQNGGAGCVELRMVTVPDVAKVREAAGKLLESLAPGARDSVWAAIQSVQVMNEVVLVTRPESLAPQWVRKVRRTTARVREGDAVQEDIKITRYHWRD